MNNNIEDIYIGANSNQNKKKGKNILLFFIIFLFIILICMGGAYWYFSNFKRKSVKQTFFQGLSNTNVKEIISGNSYDELVSKVLNSNYNINSSISFNTNVENTENEELQGIDFNNFTLNLKSIGNANSLKKYNELGINYSGNQLLNIKSLTNENYIAITEYDVVNKYVGINYNDLKDKYNINLDKEKINKIFNPEKIDLNDEKQKEFINSNISKISDMISEDKFEIQENLVINQNDTTIPVTGYTLKLSQEELNNILVELLKNIRNNDEFLQQLVIKDKNDEVMKLEAKPVNSVENQNLDTENVENEQINSEIDNQEEINNMNDHEDNTEQPEFEAQLNSNLDPIQGEVNEFNEEQVISSEENSELQDNLSEQENLENEIQENLETPQLELTHTANLDPVGEENKFSIFEKSDKYTELIRLLCGLKVNKTLEELQELIDSYIIEADKLTGNGLTLTVYISNEKTEKISFVLPNENTIELEILKNNENENKLKLTYLYKGKNNLFSFLNNNIEEVNENQVNGVSLDFSKIKSTSATSLDMTVNFIEDEKITRKINLKSEFEGTVSSNSIKNSMIVTVSTKENESKFIIDTSFKFPQSENQIDDLTEENCLLLESLSQEDYNITIQAVKDKINLVWNQKKEELNLIDTNTGSAKKQKLNTVSDNISRETARKALEDKILDMQNEARNNEQEFTIKSLENLQIDGYEVSSVVTDTNAVVVIDVYTFNINSEFNIIDG